MSINIPAIASEYMTSLLGMVTFDPLPQSSLINYFGFDPKWTDKLPTKIVVERLNITDRAFLNVLGSVFIVIVAFVFTQVTALVLSVCSRLFGFKKIHKML